MNHAGSGNGLKNNNRSFSFSKQVDVEFNKLGEIDEDVIEETPFTGN